VTDLAIRERLSPNHGSRRGTAPVDMLVIHYTGMDSADAALDRLCDPASEVSAHYMIVEDGAVWRLVPEERRAWHAGRSFWAGETDINSRSIGIELVNPGHGPEYRPYPDAQMRALEVLAHAICRRHPIPSHRVLGHSDVAPGRKRDPGELFDWKRLAAAGIGLWPNMAPEQIGPFEANMRTFGYLDASAEAIAAFQLHFRPASVTGIADDETRARLAALVMQAGLA
jgi:N-acetylmuramoyl-L-alanine amidase